MLVAKEEDDLKVLAGDKSGLYMHLLRLYTLDPEFFSPSSTLHIAVEFVKNLF